MNRAPAFSSAANANSIARDHVGGICHRPWQGAFNECPNDIERWEEVSSQAGDIASLRDGLQLAAMVEIK